jgi:hypothetical protein
MHRCRTHVVTLLAALLLGTAPTAAESTCEASLEAVVAAGAQSPVEHAALALHYGERAAGERARAERIRAAAHRRVGKLGASAWNAVRGDPGRDHAAAAARYAQLATEHEREARLAGQR